MFTHVTGQGNGLRSWIVWEKRGGPGITVKPKKKPFNILQSLQRSLKTFLVTNIYLLKVAFWFTHIISKKGLSISELLVLHLYVYSLNKVLVTIHIGLSTVLQHS